MATEADIRATRKATRSAVNKTAAKSFTAASRKVREVYNIKAGDLKKYVKIRPARGEVYENEIRVASKRRIPLHAFGPRVKLREIVIRRKKDRAEWSQRMQFVSVKVKKAGGYKPVEKTFTAKMRSGHVGIFERAENWRHRLPVKNSGRAASGLPIREKFGPGMVTLFEKEGEPQLIETYDREISIIFERELKYYMGQERNPKT